ncbi:MAG: HAD family hydrolase [Lachnospira sp.]
MIKFIASDLDGTILQNGAQSVDKSLIDVVDRLVDHGIYFAPASGRQIVSLKRLFQPISDRLVYISENGALIEYQDKVIGKTSMDRELALEIIDDVLSVPNCEVLVSGQDTAYIKPKTKEYYHRMTEVVNYNTTLVERFDDIEEDILKIAVCDLSGISNSADYFKNKWNGKASILVSGKLYLDFMDNNVNKGNAVRQIQHYFRLSPSECMAFGDNYNDIVMLENVSYSYAMDNAVDDVKKHGNFVTDSVEKTLRETFSDFL